MFYPDIPGGSGNPPGLGFGDNQHVGHCANIQGLCVSDGEDGSVVLYLGLANARPLMNDHRAMPRKYQGQIQDLSWWTFRRIFLLREFVSYYCASWVSNHIKPESWQGLITAFTGEHCTFRLGRMDMVRNVTRQVSMPETNYFIGFIPATIYQSIGSATWSLLISGSFASSWQLAIPS